MFIHKDRNSSQKKPETQMDMIGRERESKRAAQKHIECAREINAEKRF